MRIKLPLAKEADNSSDTQLQTRPKLSGAPGGNFSPRFRIKSSGYGVPGDREAVDLLRESAGEHDKEGQICSVESAARNAFTMTGR